MSLESRWLDVVPAIYIILHCGLSGMRVSLIPRSSLHTRVHVRGSDLLYKQTKNQSL